MIKQKCRIGLLLLAAGTILFSCSDRKQYEMELVFQREITAKMLYDNDRILMRIGKEVADNGARPKEVAVLDHAKHIRDTRNRCIGSSKSVDGLIENIKEAIKITDDDDSAAVALLNYYRKEVHKKNDSLVFQKFVNVYLTFEQKILDEDLMNVTSCNWGNWLNAHVSKTADTIRVGELYELAVIPENFDHNISYVNDDCKIIIYKNGEPVQLKYSIIKKGSVYLISLTSIEPGNYIVRGSFTQRTRLHSYIMNLKFTDMFVVKE